MKKEITSINGKQTAKVVAIAGALFSLIFTIIGILLLILGIAVQNVTLEITSIFYILMPLWYFILVYIFSRFEFWIYNKVAKNVGGIMFDLEDAKD